VEPVRPIFAAKIKTRRIDRGLYSNWRWHLDEMFVRISGETHYLWRAVDYEGEVLEAFVTKRRDRRAAWKFLKRAIKRSGPPKIIVTDQLQSYRAAMNVIGNAKREECVGRLNNRVENSHQPFRRREGTMAKFRYVKTLQESASVHASVRNQFNLDRQLSNRATFKQGRTAALDEWSQIAA
jgi:putative transposase